MLAFRVAEMQVVRLTEMQCRRKGLVLSAAPWKVAALTSVIILKRGCGLIPPGHQKEALHLCHLSEIPPIRVDTHGADGSFKSALHFDDNLAVYFALNMAVNECAVVTPQAGLTFHAFSVSFFEEPFEKEVALAISRCHCTDCIE